MQKHFTSVVLLASMLLTPATGLAAQTYETSLGDPVLHWNAIANQAVADDHSGTFGPAEQGGPTKASRALAIVHVAIYDAVNSIEHTHQPYIKFVPVPPNMSVSVDAAVAEAAHKTLTALYPSQKSVFDAALTEHNAKIPKVKQVVGSMIGRIAATNILNARRRDNANAASTYALNGGIAHHQIDPTNPGQPAELHSWWGKVTPFTMTSGSQFRTPPPPALTSQEYADAFNEVKDYGGDGITSAHHRDLNQTEMGLYWGYDGTKKLGPPPRLYNQITRVIAVNNGNTVAQNARLFALMNMAQADAGIGAWESKYFYDFWRPIAAIRDTRDDGNPNTTSDPTWTPLGAPATNQSNGGKNFTPPFSAYPSGHATFGGAAFGAIRNFYGTDNVPFTFTSDELNGVSTDNLGVARANSPRTYNKLSDAIFENAKSRIYLGIHWNFDATEGINMGTKIADQAFQKYLRPLGN